VGFDLLAASGCAVWWGIVVLCFGAVSSVLGVTYALAEHDIKRLLAYHSVENIGIILLGVGIGLIGWGMGNTVLAVLGLMAALFHTLNHAVFKGLLFLGAGSLLHAVGTRNMEVMGGLAKRMPVTSICFLIASLAISAIPPLNGFVSEWFTYQGLFTAAFAGDAAVKLFAGFAAVALALTGALAVTCFVKAYGVSFLSAPRSQAAANAKEVPGPMKLAQVLLAILCVFLGVGAPVVVPYMQGIATSLIDVPAIGAVQGAVLVNPALQDSFMSTPLVAVLLVACVLVPVIIRGLAKGKLVEREDPWACGYQPDGHMPVLASTVAAQVREFYAPFYAIRDKLSATAPAWVSFYRKTVKGAEAAEKVGDRDLVHPVAAFVEWISSKVQVVEGGNFRVYIVYIVVALIVFLLLTVVL
jgi:hydrogenase-4 component B